MQMRSVQTGPLENPSNTLTEKPIYPIRQLHQQSQTCPIKHNAFTQRGRLAVDELLPLSHTVDGRIETDGVLENAFIFACHGDIVGGQTNAAK